MYNQSIGTIGTFKEFPTYISIVFRQGNRTDNTSNRNDNIPLELDNIPTSDAKSR